MRHAFQPPLLPTFSASVVLILTPLAHSEVPLCNPACCSAGPQDAAAFAAASGTVPLRRTVVEDMLVQRLTDRQVGLPSAA